MLAPAPTILIVQDRPAAAQGWTEAILNSPAARGFKTPNILRFDFRNPLEKLLPLVKGETKIDWMLTDLTIDVGDDSDPADSRGIRLIETLSANTLFTRYRDPVPGQNGVVVSIAVCSVLIERGRVADANLKKRLSELQIRDDSLFARDERDAMAKHVFEDLARRSTNGDELHLDE